MSAIASAATDAQDEYFLDTPIIRAFMQTVRHSVATHMVRDAQGAEVVDVPAVLHELQPRFADLLADPAWLPDEFAAPYAASGMGGGIASWLLFRAADRSLSLFSLVVPAGSTTPVHDHLAWGFVGLYRGEQEETVYQRATDANAPDELHAHSHHNTARAVLTVAEVNHLKPGDFYALLPPDGDIHAVTTVSPQASISIHLLANDTGCVVRHAFDLTQGVARAFRSGYSNVACRDDI